MKDTEPVENVEDTPTMKEFRKLFEFVFSSELRIKDAVCFNKRISYFRGDEFLDFIEDNLDEVKEMMPIFSEQYDFKDPESRLKFLQGLLDHKILIALERMPDEKKKFKYPKALIWSRAQKAVEKGFYFVTIQSKSKYRNLLMTVVLIGVAALCLFPVWPLAVKIGIFYTCIFLLYLIFGIIFGRIGIWAVFRIFGVDVWVMPNIFLEVTAKEAFWPMLSVEKAEEDWKTYIFRFVGMIFIAFFAFIITQNPQVLKSFGFNGVPYFDNIIEWGKQKLDPNETMVTIRGKKNVKNYDDIMKETAIHEDENFSSTPEKHEDASNSADAEDDKEEESYNDVELERDNSQGNPSSATTNSRSSDTEDSTSQEQKDSDEL